MDPRPNLHSFLILQIVDVVEAWVDVVQFLSDALLVFSLVKDDVLIVQEFSQASALHILFNQVYEFVVTKNIVYLDNVGVNWSELESNFTNESVEQTGRLVY